MRWIQQIGGQHRVTPDPAQTHAMGTQAPRECLGIMTHLWRRWICQPLPQVGARDRVHGRSIKNHHPRFLTGHCHGQDEGCGRGCSGRPPDDGHGLLGTAAKRGQEGVKRAGGGHLFHPGGH